MTAVAETQHTATQRSLRNLYFTRFGVQLAWAIIVGITASTAAPATPSTALIALLVFYPAFDVVCAIIDYRNSGSARPGAALYFNMALSTAAAVALLAFSATGSAAVLVIWGIWAITAGLVQLIVALRRRQLGGQLPMILSGSISVFGGSTFILVANTELGSIVGIAGYAAFGGLFFLASAIRLNSTLKRA